jgi:hypothetical protein
LKEIKMLLEMKKVQIFGLRLECLEKEFHIYLHLKTGGQLDQLDHVDLIVKYFIG